MANFTSFTHFDLQNNFSDDTFFNASEFEQEDEWDLSIQEDAEVDDWDQVDMDDLDFDELGDMDEEPDDFQGVF